MIIRQAAPADSQSLGRLIVDSLRDAYRPIAPEAWLDGLSVQEQAEACRMLLIGDGVAGFTAMDGDEAIGFAVAGPECRGNPIYRGEIYAIHVHPNHRREGMGRSLMRILAKRLGERGRTSLLAWTPAGSAAAAFCERLGGRPIERRSMELAGQSLGEVCHAWRDTTPLLRPSSFLFPQPRTRYAPRQRFSL